MSEMQPCSVSRCGAATSQRCDCCGRPFCSAACSQAAWAEHRSGGESVREASRGCDELCAPKAEVGAEVHVPSEYEGEAAAPVEAEAAALLPHACAGKSPAEKLASTEPVLKCAFPPCDLPRIGFCTRCLLVGWCSAGHQKAHWKAGHKAACAPAETRLVPALSWEQRVMAEAKAAAPASHTTSASATCSGRALQRTSSSPLICCPRRLTRLCQVPQRRSTAASRSLRLAAASKGERSDAANIKQVMAQMTRRKRHASRESTK